MVLTYFTWYFALESTSINSWKQFEALFLQNFGDDNTPEDLVIELFSSRIKSKEGVKDYNQRFSCLKNRTPATVLPMEELLIAYYIRVYLRLLPCGSNVLIR